MSRVALLAAVTVQFQAQAQTSLAAYLASGGTPSQCQSDVSTQLTALGTVQTCVVTFDTSLVGSDYITLRITFTPTATITTDILDNAILTGINYQPTARWALAGNVIVPAAIAMPMTSWTLAPGTPGAGAPSAMAYQVGASYLITDSTVTTSVVGENTASPPDGNVFSALNAALSTQQSTDPNANGVTPLGDAAANLVNTGGIDWKDVGYVILVIGALGAAVALAYFFNSVTNLAKTVRTGFGTVAA